MSILTTWARRWSIPLAAVHDLQQRMGAINTDPPAVADKPRSEAAVSNAVRIAASRQGWRLWRNNVGALLDARGVPVRYGLCNDTAALNKQIKSSDLIGIRPGGQFVAIEVKEEGWRFTGTAHELAQQRFLDLVVSLGGEAKFVSHEGQL